jgi:predicted nuclease with RNAse H fold
VITVGVDLAAEPDNTGLVVVKWSAAGAVVTAAQVGVDDNAILAATRGAEKVGIDCPIGWPDAFVTFVKAHHDGRLPVPAALPGREVRRPLANRRTDDVVHEQFKLMPLSVSADRIARPAMRAAGLLSMLAADGRPVDRTGTGLVVEVYPAASLKQWRLRHRGYKGKQRATELDALFHELLDRADWLDPGNYVELLRTSDHVFDALIASLTARAVRLGHTLEPTKAQAVVAAREGWIAVPVEPLERLGPNA